MKKDGNLLITLPWIGLEMLTPLFWITSLNTVTSSLHMNVQGFLLHGRSQRKASGRHQIGRVPPYSFENVYRSVVVPVDCEAAMRASMHPHCEAFLDGFSTTAAFLRSAVCDCKGCMLTGPFCLVSCERLQEMPRGVCDALRKIVVLEHVPDAQVLEGNEVEAVDEIPRELVCEVEALVPDLSVRPGDLQPLSASILRALLLSGEPALLPGELYFRPLEEFRWLDLLAGAQSDYGFKANVNAGGRFGLDFSHA